MSKVEKNSDNLTKCACPQCPSYIDCARGKNELLYCAEAVGKSACEYQMNGCVCGPCPVHEACGLTNGYYCVNGSAEEIG